VSWVRTPDLESSQTDLVRKKQQRKHRERLLQCSRGHKLVAPNVYVDGTGSRKCRLCRAHAARVARARRAAMTPQVLDEEDVFLCCENCGRKKWEDHRRLCFQCAADEAARQRNPIEGNLDAMIALESAPLWVRNGTLEDKLFWLEGRRDE